MQALNPESCSLNPEPCRLKPDTRHPIPDTRHPKLGYGSEVSGKRQVVMNPEPIASRP